MNGLKRSIAALLGCLILPAAGAFAQAGTRLTDKDVKSLVEALEKSRDRFEDQLDGKFKSTILRLPSGEVNVARFLDDLQENTGRLKERFTTEYAASAEVAAVLRQATGINAFMKQQPAGMKGASDWDHLAGDLGRLAAVYGTKFPLVGDGPVRRISDGEAANAAVVIEEQADAFKDAVNREAALAKPAKDGLKGQADHLKDAAKALKSRLKESKPATAEARQVFEALSALRGSAKGVSPATLSVIGQMQAPLATLSQAFGIAVPASGT
jgi:hypothetical protein